MKESPLQKLVHDNAYDESIASAVASKHDAHQECKHCGDKIPTYRKENNFCCNGCELVYGLIHAENLGRFYDLKADRKLQPKILFFKRKQNMDWVSSLDIDSSPVCELSVEGIECTACVWLMKTLAKRMDIPAVEINSASGRMKVLTRGVTRQHLKDFFSRLQEFGYWVSIAQKKSGNREAKSLLLRMGIVSASVMNSMMFSFAMYLGLTSSEPFLFQLFSHLNFLFCILAVGVGGSYFFRKAWAGIKMRVFHFDLPVSFGILAAFLGSTYSYFWGNREHVYFDTLCTFIFLMLLGRFLQVKWVEKNKDSIANMKDLESMTVKRVSGQLEEIPIHQIQIGDKLMIPSGAMVPVLSELEYPDAAELSQEWITGESTPVHIQSGQLVAAGSHNSGMQPVFIRTKQEYRSGDLANWVFSDQEKTLTSNFWQGYAQKYTLMVMGLLLVGFFSFAFTDLERAIKTAVTISLVTCPCGIGIAIPMAQMFAQRRLLSMGIYLRDLNMLEHLNDIKTMVFDKTGTLTLADLRIKNPEILKNLAAHDLAVLFHASSQSQHPVSRAIYQHLVSRKIPYVEMKVIEIPGKGLDIENENTTYFLGRADTGDSLIFEKNGVKLVSLEFEETLLEDAAPIFQKLKNDGYQLQVLSGDRFEKVSAVARQLGLSSVQQLSKCTPADKEEWIRSHHPANILFLGDGLNDSLALRLAKISGVSISNSLSLASNANFYFSTLNIRWLPDLMQLGKKFSSVVRSNVLFSIAYNIVAVMLSMAQFLDPFSAAIIMPTVSFSVVGISIYWMKKVAVWIY
ncbi:MAG: heavy metal translocating P-type ATPase metal-binding domain-containing protein [Proteobacteria bacterium]|nr:heavy metal translocating P-type ATPase metal-binding domain-containing protein [Pseudomonadota bacterium]